MGIRTLSWPANKANLSNLCARALPETLNTRLRQLSPSQAQSLVRLQGAQVVTAAGDIRTAFSDSAEFRLRGVHFCCSECRLEQYAREDDRVDEDEVAFSRVTAVRLVDFVIGCEFSLE